MTNATVYLNGSYLAKGDAHLSPDDRGFLFADGIYEVIRAYGGQFYAMQPHLERMANGLHSLRIDGADVPGLARVCAELLRRNGLTQADALVYIQVTRGVAVRGHGFPDPPVPPTVYATTMPFKAKGDPAEGVAVITAPDHRWTRCDIKAVALLPNCMAFQDAQDAGAQEAVLVRDGVALEGTHTSFFAVLDGVVRTAPRSNYILPSITRQAVLDICREQDIPAAETPVLLHELWTADELFLAGTTMEIMPIVRVDGRSVGTGNPGPLARRLLEHFHARTP
ncbi:MAG: aminotransferase class IV [Gemmatimonadota bacterium]|nr:MAG: aminotransferase class IV [Gemmatimonadota bacterium]